MGPRDTSCIGRLALLALCAAFALLVGGCAKRPPPQMTGGPVQVRRGLLWLPPRFYKGKRQVDAESAKQHLRSNPGSAEPMATADLLDTVANVAAIATWVPVVWGVTDGFGQGAEGKAVPFAIAGGVAFGAWVGFDIAADGQLLVATDAYNRSLPPDPLDAPAPLLVSPVPPPPNAASAASNASADEPPSALAMERAAARATSWLFALQQRDAALLAARMEAPVTFRGLAPDDLMLRETCVPGKEPGRLLNLRVDDSNGLAKVVACLLSDSALLSALTAQPELVHVRPLPSDRLVGSLARFAAPIDEVRAGNLLFELRHPEQDIVYGFLAVRRAEGDDVGLVSAVIIARVE